MFGLLSKDTFSVVVEKVAKDCNIDDLMNLCRVNNALRKLVYSALDKFRITLYFQKTTEFDMDFFSKFCSKMSTAPELVIYNSYSEKFINYYADCFDFQTIDFSKAQYSFDFINRFRDRINIIEFSKNYKFTYDFIIKCESENITNYNALQYNKYLPYKILVDYSHSTGRDHPMPIHNSYVDFVENVDYSQLKNFEQTIIKSKYFVDEIGFEELDNYELGNDEIGFEEIGFEELDNNEICDDEIGNDENLVIAIKANWNKLNSPYISIDWNIVSANIELRESELYIIEDYIDFSSIVVNPTLTYKIVQKYIDCIDLNALTRIYPLTEEQIMQLEYRITRQNLWYNILQYQKLTLSIIKNSIGNPKQKWLSLSKNKNLTQEIIELYYPLLNHDLIKLHNPNIKTQERLNDELFYINLRNN